MDQQYRAHAAHSGALAMSVLDLFRLDGKTALVTGANRGLGHSIALGLAQAGADIIGLSRGEEAADTANEIKTFGQRYHHLSADLSALDANGLHQVVVEAVKAMGKLDILVNNAGVILRTPAADYSESDWDSVIQINLKAVFFLSQAAGRHMVSRGGGKIINIASILSYQGGINVPAYTASKHGVVGLTQALANEWAKQRVNVNAIAPGYMVTDNTAALRGDTARNQAILDRIPAGRWGQPSELQGSVVFLASAASDYVHGATIHVDGGWMAR